MSSPYRQISLATLIVISSFSNNSAISGIRETKLFAQFSENAKLQIEKGNKAAGMRARKASLELEKLLKQFRKESLEASK